MFEYTPMFNPVQEKIVDVVSARTQNQDRPFFRVITAQFMSKMASNMHVSVKLKGRGVIPVNMYATCLSPSGTGKGYSIGIIEDEIFKGFERRFLDTTMPEVVEENLTQLADKMAALSGEDAMLEQERVQKVYNGFGEYAYTFDSGSPEGVKQLRNKILYGKAGALSYAVDEIGSNLLGSTDILNLYLELFDLGKTKSKLVKNTSENVRIKDIDGSSPTNMLLFGTPHGVMDGHVVERSFDNFLKIGYARRCFFAWGEPVDARDENITPEEAYYAQANLEDDDTVGELNSHFFKLADPKLLNWVVDVPDEVGIAIMAYIMHCKDRAKKFRDIEKDEAPRAEMENRFFKAAKLAAVYAFTERAPEMTMDHWYQAVTMAEESGEAFNKIVSREPEFARLARFIAEYGSEVTHADLAEALPFFKAKSNRKELIDNAIAWGYKNHVVLRKSFTDGIEFLSGECLKETKLDDLIISHSDKLAHGYTEDSIEWDELVELVTEPDYNFCVHSFVDGHRTKEDAEPGFNLVVLDIDGTTSLEFAQEVFSKYKYIMYTTKSHTDDDPHFRIVLPMNYELFLDEPDYKEFMNGIFKWLPFEVDEGGNQQSRKWATHEDAEVFENDGELFDALPYIPRTSRNDVFNEEIKELGNLGNLERWFASQMKEGNRNNLMLKYALALADTGFDLDEVEENVKRFNKQVKPSLPVQEIDDTIMTTVAKRYV